jgi:hypothetical protein
MIRLCTNPINSAVSPDTPCLIRVCFSTRLSGRIVSASSLWGAMIRPAKVLIGRAYAFARQSAGDLRTGATRTRAIDGRRIGYSVTHRQKTIIRQCLPQSLGAPGPDAGPTLLANAVKIDPKVLARLDCPKQRNWPRADTVCCFRAAFPSLPENLRLRGRGRKTARSQSTTFSKSFAPRPQNSGHIAKRLIWRGFPTCTAAVPKSTLRLLFGTCIVMGWQADDILTGR